MFLPGMTDFRVPESIPSLCFAGAPAVAKGNTGVNDRSTRKRTILGLLLGAMASIAFSPGPGAQTYAQVTAPAKNPPTVGTIKDISANSLTLSADSGGE